MARAVVSSFTVQASSAAHRAAMVNVLGEALGQMHPWREAERLGRRSVPRAGGARDSWASSELLMRPPSCQLASCARPRRPSGTRDFLRVCDLGTFCMRVGMKIATRFYTHQG